MAKDYEEQLWLPMNYDQKSRGIKDDTELEGWTD